MRNRWKAETGARLVLSTSPEETTQKLLTLRLSDDDYSRSLQHYSVSSGWASVFAVALVNIYVPSRGIFSRPQKWVFVYFKLIREIVYVKTIPSLSKSLSTIKLTELSVEGERFHPKSTRHKARRRKIWFCKKKLFTRGFNWHVICSRENWKSTWVDRRNAKHENLPARKTSPQPSHLEANWES